MDNFLLPKEATIVSRRQEAADTWTLSFVFKDPAFQKQYRFLPGQFNMVGLWGVGEAPISFSSPVSGDDPFLHTVRVVGNVTQSLIACRDGETAWIRGPYGKAWPGDVGGDQDLLLVAGGIGLAPLRPVIEEWLSKGTTAAPRSGRLISLYGAQTPKGLLFGSDFDRWRGDPSARILTTVDRDEGGGHRTGLVTALLDDVPLDPRRTTVFVCGPEIMMRLTSLALRKRGIAANQIFVSLERHMKCAVGQCGHCLYGPYFVCKDGPVFRLDALSRIWGWGM